jgi:hypothetical protein
MRAILCWGAHAPSRAGDDALVIALPPIKVRFGEGAETSTRGACAPRKIRGQWSVVRGRRRQIGGRR